MNNSVNCSHESERFDKVESAKAEDGIILNVNFTAVSLQKVKV
jgi:hypothetical protein